MKRAHGQNGGLESDGSNPPGQRLAVASNAAPRYSETFIRMQMERLPCKLRIHGQAPAWEETIPGGALQPLRSLPGLLKAVYCYGIKKTGTAGMLAWEVQRRLKAQRVGVVLANYGSTASALLPVCQSLRIPLVAHFHGVDAHAEKEVQKHRLGYAALGQHAAAVVAVSRRMVSALIALGIPESRLHLIRYGVDPDRFREKTDFPAAPLFFGAGRFVDKKAPYLTLLAFSEVRRQHPEARLVLGGEGALVETTRNLCGALGLNDAVEFPGILKPEEVGEWMQRATAFVQHSLCPAYGPFKGDCEGTPVTILEALVSGLPVISTRHAGIEEVVSDGTTGFLVQERDVAGMASAMNTLAASPELARRLGAAGRRDALAKYTATHYLDSLEAILRSVSQPGPRQ
jgi:colanic acid/amylovoran biosynthesis glycosyltransferase